MDQQLSSAAPDAGSVLKFVTSLLWRSKWLIGGASILAAGLAYALAQAYTVPIWTARTTLRIGLAPSIEYLLRQGGALAAPIETPRSTVERITENVFRSVVARRAAFEPATAAISGKMVFSSLRAVALSGDRDVSIELSAGSAADARAAFRVIAAEIDRAHSEILNRRLQLLQSGIEDAKNRIALIEKSSSQLNDRILSMASEEKNQLLRSSILAPIQAPSIPAWNELQDRIQLMTNLKGLSEPSVMRPEMDISIQGPRLVGVVRSSILAGLAMLIAMIVLTIAISPRMRASAD
jgi:hypothetical protein